MAIISAGIPNRVYFELYAGSHPSEKIYSVQVKDWKYPEDVAAVVQTEQQSLANRESHLKVEPTEELVRFMNARGIELPDEIWVQPLAYQWLDNDQIEVEEDVVITEPQQKENTNNKSLLAMAIALVSLLLD